MQEHLIRISGTDAMIGISPIQIEQDLVVCGWKFRLWTRVRVWIKRLLPFMFLLTISAEEATAPAIPDNLQVRYWQVQAELSQVVQEMVLFCKGEVALSQDKRHLYCALPTPPAPPATKEIK